MLSRPKALRLRHRLLEAQIHDEQRSPKPDSLRLFALKRARLRLREEIKRIENATVARRNRWFRSQPARA